MSPQVLPPEVLAMVLADGVHRDPATGKCYILGTYSTIFTNGFPCTHSGIVLYAALSNGHGATPLTVRLVDEDDARPPVFEANATVNFPDPLTVAEIVLGHPAVVFPAPGRYSLQLRCAGQLLRERRISVLRQGAAPPAAAAP